jgi:hypothetical protein
MALKLETWVSHNPLSDSVLRCKDRTMHGNFTSDDGNIEDLSKLSPGFAPTLGIADKDMKTALPLHIIIFAI